MTRRHFFAASLGVAGLVAAEYFIPRSVVAQSAADSPNQFPTIIISPGVNGGSTGGFQDGLQPLLREAGINFRTFEAPRGNQMKADIWISRICDPIADITGPFAFVGNSFGAQMMFRAASIYDFNGRLQEIFSFSCRYGDFTNASSDLKTLYLNNPIIPEAVIKNLGGRSPWISHSRDDQTIYFNPNADNLANAFRTNVWPFTDQGHFDGVGAGKTMFAVIKHALKIPDPTPAVSGNPNLQ